MHNPAAVALLPAGLMDVLPPFAAFEARTVERLIAHFAGYGYERVKPPLIEFEETMLAGSGAALAAETFRLMDPVSQRMLALRPDMTMQVARIASSRLAHWPRPLRLGYAGQVVRVRGSQLRPERQFGQVGAEIVGSESAAADVEVIVMATSALAEVGVAGLTIDLGTPNLVPAILAASSARDEAVRARLRLALDRKDAGAIDAMAPAFGQGTTKLLSTLVATNGPAEPALATLSKLDLPPDAAAERARLIAVHDGLRSSAPKLTLTIDAVESRGFEYHTGVTFAVFAAAAADELGRGGRYRTEAGEAATGVTLFMDAVLRVLPQPEPQRRVLIPADTPVDVALQLRRQGWAAVRSFDAEVDPAAEALRLGCSHVFIDGETRGTASAAGSRPQG
jgi:ATP phosphoribosyltransferase regulatory subunit